MSSVEAKLFSIASGFSRVPGRRLPTWNAAILAATGSHRKIIIVPVWV